MAKAKKSTNNLLNAVLYIAIGVLFCIFKASVLNWLMTIVGIFFIVEGILSIINKDVTSGVVAIVIGVVLILGGWLFIQVVLIVFGILVVIKGILDLI